ncbi:uncharacterized protein TRAVEDRAFT_50887 [Trametes versicolor FP-101664 SS1]|uniref:uncharacterized protein n=1 Tax=Trametes versicolor (strain FP-101664) TaxID=717944 RepID=UPI00046248FA|nr:uncharacterized protein TRAVEDRAFT_50887 [Trametes versicolor FP-101664 SS1]EIW54746.1 hypothetical protein TRAVEDRAFT_50887 [Trametes versicolor FP-101664 SS1]
MFKRPQLEGWERADKLNVRLTGYGWAKTRMAAHFYFPEDFNLDHIDTMLRAFTRDIKYTKDWGCESCGDPAQEVVFEYIADSPSGLKLVVASAHFMCSKDQQRAVHKGVSRVHDTMDYLGLEGAGAPYPSMAKRPAGVVYALARGCAGCRMTRYCGTVCQKRDWARHKGVCGKVHEVVFENWT